MSSPSQPGDWTVQRILDWTAAHLKARGSDTPRLDAEILLAHARGCRRIDLYTRFDEAPTEAQRAAMRDLVQRRANHEPVAYLVGHREFYNLSFRVTPDVLIPRPDTETLVMEILSATQGVDAPALLEVGTGSGCIAVSVAKNKPGARVTAIDLSGAALAVARENAAKHAVKGRITFLEGDLFAPLPPEAEGTFDVLASNPPYVRADEFEALDPDSRLHEPRQALVGGEDGLAVTRRLIADGHRFLRPGGRLMIEIGHEQGDAVRALLESHGRYDDVDILRDLARCDRVASARRRDF